MSLAIRALATALAAPSAKTPAFGVPVAAPSPTAALAVRAAATPEQVAEAILAGDRLLTNGACQPCSMALRTASAIALAEAGELEQVDRRLNDAERIGGMWQGGPWVAALWEARGVQRHAQGKEDRALAAFDEAASRYEELGRRRDQARCKARMGDSI